MEVPYQHEELPEPKKYDLEDLARLGYRVYPYSPVESLLPRYWLPEVGADEMGLRYGLSTSGMDALQERAYSFTATYGIESGRPGYQAEYSQTIGDERRPVVLITAEDQPVLETAGGDQPGDATLELDLPTFFNRLTGVVFADAGMVWAGRSRLSGLPTGWSCA